MWRLIKVVLPCHLLPAGISTFCNMTAASLVSSWRNTNVFFSFFQISTFKITFMIQWFVNGKNCTLLLGTQSSRAGRQSSLPRFMAALHALPVLLVIFIRSSLRVSVCLKWQNFPKASKQMSKENRRWSAGRWVTDWQASSCRISHWCGGVYWTGSILVQQVISTDYFK